MRVFTETQKFDQWWLLVLIYGLLLASTIGLFLGISSISENDISEILIERLPPFVILAVIALLFYSCKLKTKIDEKGIHYGFWPFQRKLQLAAWDEVEKVYIRKYSPLTEYGGWGYKFSLSGRGKVYNTKGNMGIQIVFKDNNKTLIGTQQPNAAQQVLNRYIPKENNYEN
ncbi:hypothetical protein [Marinirhabdus gelatinilytica]|uniref:PH (Pleckstrin Homology) domain-containing protein n=1 Tax=Marinirhabdus gelatinilytica TaxID=1703343 RepID=A0A370Q968_9FLAO|nr:hypothetical protein [Marinirhabdus gelatinilytica]RDK84896.1 hypothetical protein C8D94_104280 [Marinirhabdus gelatinilytica]